MPLPPTPLDSPVAPEIFHSFDKSPEALFCIILFAALTTTFPVSVICAPLPILAIVSFTTSEYTNEPARPTPPSFTFEELCAQLFVKPFKPRCEIAPDCFKPSFISLISAKISAEVSPNIALRPVKSQGAFVLSSNELTLSAKAPSGKTKSVPSCAKLKRNSKVASFIGCSVVALTLRPFAAFIFAEFVPSVSSICAFALLFCSFTITATPGAGT